MGEFECKIKELRNILILSHILSVSKLERALGYFLLKTTVEILPETLFIIFGLYQIIVLSKNFIKPFCKYSDDVRCE